MADAPRPRPWKDAPPSDPAEARAAELVAHAARVPPRQVDVARGWDGVIERATKQPRGRPVSALAAVATLLLVVVAGELFVRRGVFGGAPSFVAAAETRWHRDGDEGVVLESGRLEVSRPHGKVVLRTAHVTVVAVNARFLADTTRAATLVEVYEGEVVVRREGAEVAMVAGERRTWPDELPVPAALVLPRTPPERCTDDLGPDRRACLWNQGEAPGLVAQAALFELGLFELGEGNNASAEAAWRRSLDRFPDGVLAPEVRLSLLGELTRARRFQEAVQIAKDFERLSAADPRLAEVKRFRAELEEMASLGVEPRR